MTSTPRQTLVRRRSRWTHLVAFLAMFAAAAVASPVPSQESTPAQIQALLGQLEKRSGDQYWAGVSRLQSLGTAAIQPLRDAIGTVGERARLACAKILLELDDETISDSDLTIASSTLDGLAREARDREVRLAALQLYGLYGEIDQAEPVLEETLATAKDPMTVIRAAEALWELNRSTAGREKLLVLLKLKDFRVRREAALTLAQMGYFEGEVRTILQELETEPSEQGRRAAILGKVQELSRQLDRKLDSGEILLEGVNPTKLLQIRKQRIEELEAQLAAATEGGPTNSGRAESITLDAHTAILEEVLRTVQEKYVDETKVKRKDLITAAIKGMVGSLDPFSAFMTVEETRDFGQSMAGEYSGIGAHVNKRPGFPLEIRKVLHGGPAFAAGVRSSDLVVKIDDVETAPLELSVVVEKLKGPAGSEIRLTVQRVGETSHTEYTVRRGRVEVPTIYSQMLPGKIGYTRVTRFGDRTAREFTAAVDELEEDGMTGLVLDLRGNHGGRASGAINIADQFVSGSLPIISQKGRDGGESSTPADDAERPPYPMVVLINGESASASEIVAGSLQDFQRATLIGERSYGKGTVQEVVELSNRSAATLGGIAKLRLTVKYYFLPLGRLIHNLTDERGNIVTRGGIEPDIRVASRSIEAWRAELIDELQSSNELLTYVHKHREQLEDSYHRKEARSFDNYPRFEELYAALNTTLPRDDVRLVVRQLVRRALEDAAKHEFASDYLEDRQLQAALLEVLNLRGDDASTFEEYRDLGAWVEEGAGDAGEASDAAPEPGTNDEATNEKE